MPDSSSRDLEARREAALAGHLGREDQARSQVIHPSAKVRATSLGALARLGKLGPEDLSPAFEDPDPGVRKRACELSRDLPGADPAACLGDPDPSVVEAAAWALGERRQIDAVPALCDVATAHPDALCRESAVAALGAIGDQAGVHAILAAMQDRPAIRRRAVIALAPFDGEAVAEALQRALEDRDWQVRQAAEDLVSDRGP